LQRKSTRVWVYLKPSDIQYIQTVQHILGLESTSDTIRFVIRLCRLMIPRANLVSKIVSEMLGEENLNSTKRI